MKKLAELFTSNPGYMKCGNERIAKITGLKETTIKRYKSSSEYREMKTLYISGLKRK